MSTTSAGAPRMVRANKNKVNNKYDRSTNNNNNRDHNNHTQTDNKLSQINGKAEHIATKHQVQFLKSCFCIFFK